MEERLARIEKTLLGIIDHLMAQAAGERQHFDETSAGHVGHNARCVREREQLLSHIEADVARANALCDQWHGQ